MADWRPRLASKTKHTLGMTLGNMRELGVHHRIGY